MWRIPNFRSKHATVAMACCLAVLVDFGATAATPASDRDMATRYEQSAQSGDDEAQFYLGALHSAGVGRARSDTEAFRWFQRAANQGHPHAMLIIAGLYASGRGTSKDNVKAYTWAHIVAASSKVEEYGNGARQLMSLLMKKMTSDEIGQAVVAARTWRAVRSGGAVKGSYIERAIESTAEQPAPAAPPPPTPVVVRPAPVAAPMVVAATPAPAVTQPVQSTVTTMPAAPRVASAPVASTPPAKNTKREDVRDLIDQVPPNLRKRFGF
ncbi:MAG: tetratricopeptide repeat protein [Bradyrhizobium sp.]